MNPIQNFIAQLAATTPESVGLEGSSYFNPWRDTCATMDAVSQAPEGRQRRLEAHFSSPEIQVALIGEAPGYQGCRYSGMAFTSERLLLEGAIPGIPALTSRLTFRPRPWSEPSATIVWGTLKDLGIQRKVALFNAFPFHPFKPGEPLSNRTPTRSELKVGAAFLHQLLEEVLPKGVRLVAIGAKAAATLRNLGFTVPEDHAVRHPAMGGATAFRQGMADLFGMPAERSSEQPWIT